MDRPQIFIGIGGNLASIRFGPPPASFVCALARLGALGVIVRAVSGWYRSPPLPPSAQPDYINGVAAVDARLHPAGLLDLLHGIEAEFGRVRQERNAARCLDLDLLAYGDAVVGRPGGMLCIPHPRLAERAFVLVPWAELAPGWRHPVTGRTVSEMVAALPRGNEIEQLRPMTGEGHRIAPC
jgi:2-amino-4-hydroxy-6-hydroxymethyldihydropteridine diphosphokinase